MKQLPTFWSSGFCWKENVGCAGISDFYDFDMFGGFFVKSKKTTKTLLFQLLKTHHDQEFDITYWEFYCPNKNIFIHLYND